MVWIFARSIAIYPLLDCSIRTYSETGRQLIRDEFLIQYRYLLPKHQIKSAGIPSNLLILPLPLLAVSPACLRKPDSTVCSKISLPFPSYFQPFLSIRLTRRWYFVREISFWICLQFLGLRLLTGHDPQPLRQRRFQFLGIPCNYSVLRFRGKSSTFP